MSLENVLGTIRREAEDHVERHRAHAREAATEIERDARAQASAWRGEMESAAAQEGAGIRRQLVNAARLEALRKTRASQEEVFAAAHAQLREQLRSARSRPDYPRLFGALLAEAQAALPDAAVIRIDPRDAALAPHAESTLDTWGGVELEAADGRIVRNTLEERLRRVLPELRRLAAHALGLA